MEVIRKTDVDIKEIVKRINKLSGMSSDVLALLRHPFYIPILSFRH